MLRVNIEMLHGGSEEGKYHLGTVEIANDGTGTASRGNYMVRLAVRGSPRGTWRRGAVKDFPRSRHGPYDLLLLALLSTVGERNRKLLDDLKMEYGERTDLMGEEMDGAAGR